MAPVEPEPDRLIEIPFRVGPHEHGLRVDLFLSRRMKRMSRSLAARLVRQGRVRCLPADARPPGVLKASARVFEGDRVIMKRKPLAEASTDDVEVPVVYEDARVLGVNKPGDLVVHPTASHYHRTLIRILRSRRGEEALDLAHRIDKETSGLVLLARDFEAASDLKGQFARRQVDKSYLALVRGAPAADRFEVTAPLRLADTVSQVVMEVVADTHPEAQPASTEFVVWARGPDAALVEARPRTGRQHQIRVHLRHAGHPIWGDKLYLGSEAFFMEALRPEFPLEALIDRVGHHRQALHAFAATFRHPQTGAATTARAPLPRDMVELAERLAVPVPGALGPEGLGSGAPTKEGREVG